MPQFSNNVEHGHYYPPTTLLQRLIAKLRHACPCHTSSAPGPKCQEKTIIIIWSGGGDRTIFQLAAIDC